MAAPIAIATPPSWPAKKIFTLPADCQTANAAQRHVIAERKKIRSELAKLHERLDVAVVACQGERASFCDELPYKSLPFSKIDLVFEQIQVERFHGGKVMFPTRDPVFQIVLPMIEKGATVFVTPEGRVLLSLVPRIKTNLHTPTRGGSIMSSEYEIELREQPGSALIFWMDAKGNFYHR